MRGACDAILIILDGLQRYFDSIYGTSINATAAIAEAPEIRQHAERMLTGAQIRGARLMLRWSARRLASEANVGIATVQRAESVDGIPNVQFRTALAIQGALERGGIVFLDPDEHGGPGVRLRS